MRRRKEYGDRNSVGKTLYALRKKHKMKQKDLLTQLQLNGIDICAASLSELEGQKRKVTDSELVAISNIFGVSLEELLQQPKIQ